MSAPTLSPPSQHDAFREGMNRLQQSEGPAPDFIIAVDGKEWPVHKLILFCHSDVLYKMSTNAAFTEGQTGRVLLKDVEPRCVEAMVHFFYHQDYHYDPCTMSFPRPISPGPSIAPGDDSSGGEGDGDIHSTHDGDGEHEEDENDIGGGGDGGVISWDDVDGNDGASFSSLNARWDLPTRPASPESLPYRDRLKDDEEADRLEFHLAVCVLAECYNIKGLKLAAEDKIVTQHLDPARSTTNLEFVVDKIADSDAAESLRDKVIDSVIHQTEHLHSSAPYSLLDRRPQLAIAILKQIAQRRHAETMPGQRKRYQWMTGARVG